MLVRRLLAGNPADPVALQLAGTLCRSAGELAESEQLLRRSLEIDPRQPHTENNLGNVLLDLGRIEEAIAAYDRALRLHPDYAEASCNLGIAVSRAGDHARARLLLRQLLSRQPGLVRGWLALGDVERASADSAAAQAAYQHATRLAPHVARHWHKLALARREGGETAGALEAIERAHSLAPEDHEILFSRGNLLVDAGELAQAAQSYRRALVFDPAHRETHLALSRLLWQGGDMENYLSSYAEALQRLPGATELYVDYASQLLRTGRGHEALEVLARSRSSGCDSLELGRIEARVLADQGNLPASLARLEALVARWPQVRAVQVDLARVLLASGRSEEARACAQQVLQRIPDDQEALAYRGVCDRISNRADYARDFDHARLVRGATLAAPSGFRSIVEFNEALAESLRALHWATRAPMEQTLRGGTQTLGDLFLKPGREIRMLHDLLHDAVSDYVARLSRDDSHPFLRRAGRGWKFAGSWSVRLGSGGFHTNHVHGEGWISSCYYVTVPKAVSESGTRSGWLAFGQSNLGLPNELPEHYVKPESGLLVLFPSYFFHGTIPFTTQEERLTVAFDAVPG